MYIHTYVCSLFSAYALKRTSFRSLIKSQVKRVNTTQKCWIHLHIAKRLFSLFFSHFFPLPATSVCTQSSFMPQGSNNNSFDTVFIQFKSEHSLFWRKHYNISDYLEFLWWKYFIIDFKNLNFQWKYICPRKSVLCFSNFV